MRQLVLSVKNSQDIAQLLYFGDTVNKAAAQIMRQVSDGYLGCWLSWHEA